MSGIKWHIAKQLPNRIFEPNSRGAEKVGVVVGQGGDTFGLYRCTYFGGLTRDLRCGIVDGQTTVIEKSKPYFLK